MMGVPQEATRTGFLRIPSLCRFVDKIELSTPYDRYIFGTIATKYMEPTREQICQYASTYMTSELALNLCFSPDILPSITDPSYPHYNLLQMHPSARECSVTCRRSTSFTFWFFVSQLYDTTVLASFPGGSLVMESNGYFTYGHKSVFCSLNQWHMCTLETVAKHQTQHVVVGYLDAKRLAEVNALEGYSSLTIGDNKACNALWFVSAFVHASQTALTEKTMLKMFSKGPQALSQDQIHPSGGVRLVPYRGILRYMHLFGGPFFVFSNMLDCSSQEQFMMLLQAAFNLLRLGAFDPPVFFASVRYVFRRKRELYSSQAEQIMIHELGSKNGFRWNELHHLMGDYAFLSSGLIGIRFLNQIIDSHPLTKGVGVEFFHMLVDTFVFFELDGDMASALINVMKRFISANHELIKKLPLTIVAMSHCGTEDLHLSVDDDTMAERQRMLYELWTADRAIFTEQTKPDEAFTWVLELPSTFAIELLLLISEIDSSGSHYFEMRYFTNILSFFFLYAGNEKLWIVLLRFLTHTACNALEDFLTVEMARPELFPYFVELVAFQIHLEISTNNEDSVIYRLVHLLYSLMMTQGQHLSSMCDVVMHLCSLGFASRPKLNEYLPTTRAEKVDLSRYTSRRSRKTSVVIPILLHDEINPNEIENFDKSLFQATQDYMALHEVTFEELECLIPEMPIPKVGNISMPVPHLVAVMAAKALVVVSKELGLFKKAIVQLTMNGADVDPTITVFMHHEIILALLEECNQLKADSLNHFITFIQNRVLEGWWDGHIISLLEKIANSPASKNRSLSTLIIACLSVSDTAGCVAIMDVLSRTSMYNLLLADSDIMSCILYILAAKAVFEESECESTIRDFAARMASSDLAEAMQDKDKLRSWASQIKVRNQESYDRFYGKMIADMNAEAGEIARLRVDMTTLSRSEEICALQRYRAAHGTYFRRAFRFQFCCRVNQCSLFVSEGINALFKMAASLDHSRIVPTKFSLGCAPHPLVIPLKEVPLVFEYEVTFQKVSEQIPVPMSHHEIVSKLSPSSNLVLTSTGPKCMEGWRLLPYSDIAVNSMINSYFRPNGPVFACSLLSAPEPLPCVAVPTRKALYIIMSATIDSDGIVHLPDPSMICHYPLIENAMYGFMGQSLLFLNHVTIRLTYSHITMILDRTYLHKPKAVDIFTIRGVHLTLVMSERHRREELVERVKQKIPGCGKRGVGYALKLLDMGIDAVQKLWVSRAISCMDYLLYLNMKGGRSFNDYSQYPVVPWVIGDYESPTAESLALRDLSKPMGQQTEERGRRYLEIYQDTDPHYNYGTHYSYPGSVLYILMRLEPNTVYNVMLHQGFDHPDRLFFSIDEMWKSSSTTNQADVKELVPQVYTLPSVFENPNALNLPKRTDGTSLDNVELPNWALNTSDFVWTMRRYLECQPVQKKMALWIDLIFGYKQRGKAAVDAVNVFHPLSYCDCKRSTNPQEKAAEEASIINFGQCPKQIFTKEHPVARSQQDTSIFTSNFKVSGLKRFIGSVASIRVSEDRLFMSKELQHVIGSSEIHLTINDGMFLLGHHVQYDPVIFDVASSCVSSDGLFVTITSRAGYIRTYFVSEGQPAPSLILISKTLCPGTCFHVCAVSSHYGLVCAASDTDLCLYDMTTGYLLRHYPLGGVQRIVFDETHDFIIVSISDLVYVLGLDFREITEGTCEIDITSLAAGDSSVWTPRPWFVTGHSDGSTCMWEIDVHNASVVCTTLAKSHHAPIIALHVFHSNKALVSCDENGSVILLSCSKIKHKVLKSSCFNGCALCGKSFKNQEYLCSHCGLPHCRNCYIAQTKMCTACDAEKQLNTSESASSSVATSPSSSFSDLASLSIDENMMSVPAQRRSSGASLKARFVPATIPKNLSIGSFRPRASMAQIMTGTASSTDAVSEISIGEDESSVSSLSPSAPQRPIPQPGTAKPFRRIAFQGL